MTMTESLRDIAKMIDHSLLHPTLTDRELADGCALARRLDVASVCIKPYAVPLAREILAGSDVAVGTVIGFPHGNSRVDVKLARSSWRWRTARPRSTRSSTSARCWAATGTTSPRRSAG